LAELIQCLKINIKYHAIKCSLFLNYCPLMAGGAKHPAILTDNFTNFKKLDNQTNRYEVECCYCPNGTPPIINRDNKPIKHLADPKLCRNAPPDVRKQALMYLAGKKAGGALVMEFTTSEPSNRGIDPR
jgi:hypothetical protein